ncbi:MAG: hypothetical protein L0206_25130 [Actinobacteria bacterium]|nr:hypothetical protein [Actinomycetota bacterium]
MKLKKITVTTVLMAAISLAALGSATSTEAGAKPGLLPGKWHGTGVITGSVTDAGGRTTFGGKIGFRLNVAKNLEVSGTGSWVKTMKGRGEMAKSDMTGIGKMWFGGFGHNVDYMYEEHVEGTVTFAFGATKKVSFVHGQDETLRGRLVITKARHCSASGFIPTSKESGVKITWSAKRLGKCTE